MFTQKYFYEELKCHDCGMEVIEELQSIEYINNVYIDFDNGEITIESNKELTEQEIKEVVNKIVSTDHKLHEHKSHDHKDHECCSHNCTSHHHEDHEDEESHNIDIQSSEIKKHEYQNFDSLASVVTEEFNFDDIDCPNCAKKVERALNKQDKILNAEVNFINKKIIIKHYNNVEVYNIASKVLKSVESDAKLYKPEEEPKEESKTKKIVEYILLGIGFALYILSIILLKATSINPIITKILFFISYGLISYDIIFESIHGFIHKDFFNENLLMIVASLGALFINEPIEGIMVILLFKVGEFFQDLATDKSKNAIKSLIEMKKDTVTLKNGTVKNIKDVNIGEVITIHVGEQVPLDGIIKQGNTNVDMKTLTGESAPVFASIGEEILSGSVNLTRVIDVEVTKKDTESTISKVLKLVEDASNQKSKSEEFITKFARIYTPIVLGLAIIIGLIQGLVFKQDVKEIFNNVFTILVISCPCALVISIPLGYFSGIGRSSAAGILVKGGNYLEALASAKTFVFDKTGTITKGNFKVTSINAVSPHTNDEVLSLVSKVESFSMHPIAIAIKEAKIHAKTKTQESPLVKQISNALVEEISGSGLKVTLTQDNQEKVILVGNDKLMNNHNIKYIENSNVGTILYLSVNEEFYGSIVINDEIKEESYDLVKYLNNHNYQSIMLTGDSKMVAEDVTNKLGINEYHAKLLPAEKYQNLSNIIDNAHEKKNNVVYVGDGINDTPSLKVADIGIAMGAMGADSAKECADIVIMNDDISKITEAIEISKFTRKIVIENIVFSIVIKVSAIILGISGILGSLAMIIALFADVGVCLLAILNVLRILRYKKR